MLNLRLLVLSLVTVAACGGSDDTTMSSDPLTCDSIAMCTTYDVKTFVGTLPAGAGGTIHGGLYRLAYTMIPEGIDGEEGGYEEGLDALMIDGTSYNWAGFFRDHAGTLATAGTTLTFQHTHSCYRGEDKGASSDTDSYPYTATATELRLYSHVERSDGVEWDNMLVYRLVDDPSEVCDTVSSEPATPGDSADCNVSNCGCSFSIGDTVTSCAA